jgi:tetratricopeptide (TPR) repeat protein
MGDFEKSKNHYLSAELFIKNRNEHLIYYCSSLEQQGKYEEILPIIDKMCSLEKVNPFPSRTFLIENRAYLDTSNHLNEYREYIQRKLSEHRVDMNSVTFDFK